MMSRREMLDRLGLREVTLVHYDVRAADGAAKVALNRFLAGRTERRNGRTYRYTGLTAEGARWVGQSVFLLDADVADRLVAKLQELRIRHTTIDLFSE